MDKRYYLFARVSCLCAGLFLLSCAKPQPVEKIEVAPAIPPAAVIKAPKPLKPVPVAPIAPVVLELRPGNLAPTEARARESLIAKARELVGVKEKPMGSNRGPEVDSFNRAAKTDLGAPWCASVKCWIELQVGLVPYGNAYSPSWFRKAFVTLTPQPGDYALVYFPSLGRYAHTIAVIESVKYIGSRCVEIVTLEGNTNAQGSREGDQFARRIRRFDSVTCFRFTMPPPPDMSKKG